MTVTATWERVCVCVCVFMMCRIFTTFTQFSNSYLNSVWLCHVKIHQINESNDLRLLNNNDLSSLSSCDSDLHSQVYSQLLVLLFLTFILWLFFYTHTHTLSRTYTHSVIIYSSFYKQSILRSTKSGFQPFHNCRYNYNINFKACWQAIICFCLFFFFVITSPETLHMS